MRHPARFVMIPAFVFALSTAGCTNENDASMAGTKGTAPANAPKTQADFYKQQPSQTKGEPGKAAQPK